MALQIGDLHDQHGRRDMDPLLEFLYMYKGLFANVPDIVNVHRVSTVTTSTIQNSHIAQLFQSALSKVRDNERLVADGKISAQDADMIRQRVDVTS